MATDLPVPARLSLDWGSRYRLRVFHLGLACCAVEFVAASTSDAHYLSLGAVPVTASPLTADVLVVSGTVTDRLAPAVRRLYDAMPEPRYVLSFGACSNSGGPYWDSYCVTKGVDQVVPVDVYVPGCPPRPEALLDGLLQLQEQIRGAAAPLRREPAAPDLLAPPPGRLGPDQLRRPL